MLSYVCSQFEETEEFHKSGSQIVDPEHPNLPAFGGTASPGMEYSRMQDPTAQANSGYLTPAFGSAISGRSSSSSHGQTFSPSPFGYGFGDPPAPHSTGQPVQFGARNTKFGESPSVAFKDTNADLAAMREQAFKQ